MARSVCGVLLSQLETHQVEVHLRVLKCRPTGFSTPAILQPIYLRPLSPGPGQAPSFHWPHREGVLGADWPDLGARPIDCIDVHAKLVLHFGKLSEKAAAKGAIKIRMPRSN